MTRYIELHFSEEAIPSLVATRCMLAHSAEEVICRRQKYVRFGRQEGSFTWTKAVQSLCCVIVGYKIRSLIGESLLSDLQQPVIVGKRPSIASCLDDALSKQPRWLVEMFGIDRQGRSKSRQIFVVENSGFKRPGPIMIGVNPHFLPPSDIYIFMDGALATSVDSLMDLYRTLRSFHSSVPSETDSWVQSSCAH